MCPSASERNYIVSGVFTHPRPLAVISADRILRVRCEGFGVAGAQGQEKMLGSCNSRFHLLRALL